MTQMKTLLNKFQIYLSLKKNLLKALSDTNTIRCTNSILLMLNKNIPERIKMKTENSRKFKPIYHATTPLFKKLS